MGTLIPIPGMTFVGAALGGAIGGYIGGKVASEIAGQAVNLGGEHSVKAQIGDMVDRVAGTSESEIAVGRADCADDAPRLGLFDSGAAAGSATSGLLYGYSGGGGGGGGGGGR